jgi:hypothetical protein
MGNKELLIDIIIGSQPGLTECERFGMTFGCNEDCPVLEKGYCEIYESVDDFIRQHGGD